MEDKFTSSNSGISMQFSSDSLIELFDNCSDVEEIREKYDPNPYEGYKAVSPEVKKNVVAELLQKFFEESVCTYLQKNINYDLVKKIHIRCEKLKESY